MMAADPTIASNLQRAWDAILENTNIFLCISGSHLGMMVRGILSELLHCMEEPLPKWN